MLWTVIAFSVLTLAVRVRDRTRGSSALLRFLAGLGLGGVLPTALALINEYAARGRGGAATTTMMTGYHVGAVLTALLGILVIERFGWHWMFVIGALPALVLVPLMWRYLPESTAFLRARAGLADRPRADPPRPRAKPAPTRSRRCSTTGWAGRRSRSGSPRSWACCWSTASTPGCRRS